MGVSQLLGARARAAPKSTPMHVGPTCMSTEPNLNRMVFRVEKKEVEAEFPLSNTL